MNTKPNIGLTTTGLSDKIAFRLARQPNHEMNIREILSSSEIRSLTARSDFWAIFLLLKTWLLIGLIFWFATSWTNPFSILLALLLLGGQQLGLTVIMHECGHQTFFASKRLNAIFGQYFAANPTFSDLHYYATTHAEHHRKAGTSEDPDLANYSSYPVKKGSFKRKLLRDVSGQTGFKLLSYVFGSAAGIFSGDSQRKAAAKPFVQQVLANVVLAIILGVVFAPWAYALWFGSILTSFMLIVRVRQVAEHAAVPDCLSPDPRDNTRTTLASWWERLLFAPNYVNYHLEHHFMASVPCYRLPDLHRLLRERNVLDNTPVFRSYYEVLNHAVLDH
ncbi:MAG: fatty acid desaturase family protein [Pseudomonadales bacterium]